MKKVNETQIVGRMEMQNVLDSYWTDPTKNEFLLLDKMYIFPLFRFK